MTDTTSSTGTLNWTAVTGATSYSVYKDGTLIKSGVTTINYPFTGLVSGTTYTLGVRAVNAGGSSALVTKSYTPIPTEINGLNMTAITYNSGTLNWSKATGATTYNVYKYSTLVVSGLTTTSYNFTGLTSGQEYTLGVCAVNKGGSSTVITTTFTTKPDNPTNLIASAIGENFIALKWDVVKGATSYNIYKSDKTVVVSKLVATTYKIENLKAATEYTYYVAAVNAGGVGELVPVTFLTLPTNSAGLTADAVTQTTAQLVWDPVVGAKSYNLYLDGEPFESDITDTNYNLSGLTAGEEYEVGLSAVNETVEGAIVTIQISTLLSACVPENVTITNQTTDSVSLKWEEQEESSVAKYIIYRDGEYLGESITTNFTDDTYLNMVSIYTVSAVDFDGLETGQSVPVPTIDITAPAITITESQSNIMSSAIVTTFSDDNSGLDTTSFKWAYGEQDVAYFEDAGVPFDGTGFTAARNGKYTVYVLDMAGNTAVAYIEIKDVNFTKVIGGFNSSSTDLSIEAPGIAISFDRYYDSMESSVGPFGQGWSFSFYGRLEKLISPENVVMVVLPRGEKKYFRISGTTYSGINSRDNLKIDGENYLLTTDSLTYTYDKNGHLVGMTDRNGNTVAISVNESGFPTRITDSVQRTYTIDYSDNHITSITDPAGRKVTYTYDGNLLSAVNSPTGALVNQYSYDSNEMLKNIKDSYGNVLSDVNYDSDHRLLTLKTKDEETTYSYSLDAAGNQVVDDGTDSVIYDSYGNVVVAKNKAQNIYANLFGDITSTINEEGHTTVYSYNQFGEVITELTKDSSDRVISSITYNYTYYDGTEKIKICVKTEVMTSYNEDGSTTSETAVTTMTYDFCGNVQTQQLKQGDIDTTIANTYLSNGLVWTSINEKGITTTNTYDTYGYPDSVKTENADKVTTNVDYNCNIIGFVQSQNIIGGLRYSFVYDSLGNVVKQTIGDGSSDVRITRMVYDNKGNVLQKISPLEYDVSKDGLVSDGNSIAIRDTYLASDVGVQYSYNSKTGNLEETKAGSYDITYNTDQSVIGVQVAGNILASYVYAEDENKLLNSVSYANGATLSYSYDKDGNMTEMAVDGVTKYTYSYNDQGTLLSKHDIGQSYTTTYDSNEDGSKTVILKDDATGTVLDSYTYSEDASEFTEKIGNDTYGLSSSSKELTDSFTYNGNEIYKKVYTLNSEDAITEEKINSNDETILSTGYTYNITGNIIGITHITKDVTDETSYTYDSFGNIETITLNGAEKYHYYYDIADQLVRVNDAMHNKTEIYTYDKNGNILEKNLYSYNSGNLDGFTPIDTINYSYENSTLPDECTSYDGQEITYDELGNPLRYLGWDMTWEAGRRLSTMKKGSTDISFTYNDEGIRTSKTVDGVTTTYTSIDGRITSQNDGTNLMYFRYDKNNSLTGFILNGTEYIYVKNAQGDITGILDKGGKQVVSYTYDAWGKVESISGSSADAVGKLNPMRYRGYYEDTETGFFYVASRYYDPNICRFLNADEPIILQLIKDEKTNLFMYCNNNPCNMIDASGDIAGYINNQDDNTLVNIYGKLYKMKDIGWGLLGNISDNGCGVIAAYNVLISRNASINFGAVCKTLLYLGAPLLYGKLGTSPGALVTFMRMFYKNVIMTGPGIKKWTIIGRKASAVIVLYKTKNNGLHYIAGIIGDFDDNFYFYNAPDSLGLAKNRISLGGLYKLLIESGRTPLMIIGVANKKGWW